MTVNLTTPALNTGEAWGDTFVSIEGLLGSLFNDTLTGDAAANFLEGNLGNDKLTGGGGADHFVFNTAPSATSNYDTITDFVRAQGDKIDLDHLIFTTLSAMTPGGTISAIDFRANTTGVAQATTDRIIYNTTTGMMSYDRDGTGSAAAIPFAMVSGHPTLAATDFIYR